jgi:hypothetical protein
LAAAIEAAVVAAVAQALDRSKHLARSNPFARSHHSDSISVASPTNAQRFPAEDERFAFKQTVATFYGLTVDDPTRLRNMLGDEDVSTAVTLAHIWPASYTNWGDACANLALPEKFYEDPRNYLLLPKYLHDAFDKGYVVLTPSKDGITISVIRHEKVRSLRDCASLMLLHRRKLIIPQNSPYMRILANFALYAMGHEDVGNDLEGEIFDALSATSSEGGKAKGKATAAALLKDGSYRWHHR